MNRIVLALGTVAAVVACCGGPLLAQLNAPAPTRVAIINIGLVFTKYDKAKAYKDQMEKLVEPHQLDGKKLKKEMLDWSEAMKNPKFDPKDRERYEQGIRGNQRRLEDLELTVRKLIGKTQEEQVTNLYKEVQGAIHAFAKANAIQVVLGYGEQIDGDPYSFANINRKMQGMDIGSCNPLYFSEGIDISRPVVEMLNLNFQRSSGVTPVSGTTTPNQK